MYNKFRKMQGRKMYYFSLILISILYYFITKGFNDYK